MPRPAVQAPDVSVPGLPAVAAAVACCGKIPPHSREMTSMSSCHTYGGGSKGKTVRGRGDRQRDAAGIKSEACSRSSYMIGRQRGSSVVRQDQQE